MLASLNISNYALIDSISIDFTPGFNIITGETGAGKSIILGALGLLLGGRADMRTIKNAQTKSIIEARFIVDGYDSLRTHCLEADIEWDDHELIMRRELSPSGRSRAFINDSPVNLAVMQEVGSRLIDIHSQHQNQLLAQGDFQRRIIDVIAENDERLEAYGELYRKFRAAVKNFKTTKAALARDRDNSDFMEFQLGQLEALDLKEGELAQLEEDRDEAAEQTEIRGYIDEAMDIISEGDSNIISQIGRLRDISSELEHLFDSDSDILARIDQIDVELSDISDSISGLRRGSMADSVADLEYIEKRISAIYSLMRKHNCSTPEELIALHHSLQQRLDALSDAADTLAELEHEARSAKKLALEAAAEISLHRKTAAQEFAKILTDTAVPLGMKNLVCNIAVEQAEMSPTGTDTVEFRFAFNKNQTPTPIAGAASGGEISRLMLSVKSIVAHMFQLPTIIFDEVDTGVSGDVASRMGRMMSSMASNLQVITITHLPQVAARGDSHFKVYKEDDDDATHTRIAPLSQPSDRIAELALMLSGDPNSDAARINAEAQLNEAAREKKQFR